MIIVFIRLETINQPPSPSFTIIIDPLVYFFSAHQPPTPNNAIHCDESDENLNAVH